MPAYYNEHEPYAAAWLRNLCKANLIAPGRVDARDIQKIDRNGFRDVEKDTQAHFFAGIGGWSYALRLAGWPDSEKVWTGSCPCQPFSQAGRRKGAADSRHLWPEWLRLIRSYGPPVIFGEQVASPDGIKWFDTVRSDLEVAGYTVGMAVLCAAGVGAPHQRHRLFFVALTDQKRLDGKHALLCKRRSQQDRVEVAGSRKASRVAYSSSDEQRSGRSGQASGRDPKQSSRRGQTSVVGDSGRKGGGGFPRSVHRPQVAGDRERLTDGGKSNKPRTSSSDIVIVGHSDVMRSQGRQLGRQDSNEWSTRTTSRGRAAWREIEWLPCTDGKLRPAKPGIFPLAHGIPARVGEDGSSEAPASRSGMLMGAGNAIVPQVAAVFIRAVMEELGMV